MTAILTLLTPLAAELHIGALIALRVVEGFFEVGFLIQWDVLLSISFNIYTIWMCSMYIMTVNH